MAQHLMMPRHDNTVYAEWQHSMTMSPDAVCAWIKTLQNGQQTSVTQISSVLVVGWHSRPAANGTHCWIMTLSRAVLAPKVDQPEMIIVPFGFRQQHLQINTQVTGQHGVND